MSTRVAHFFSVGFKVVSDFQLCFDSLPISDPLLMFDLVFLSGGDFFYFFFFPGGFQDDREIWEVTNVCEEDLETTEGEGVDFLTELLDLVG